VGNLKRRERKEVIHGNIRTLVFMRKKHKKALTAGSIMAYWKDSIVWYKRLRQQPEDIEHSKTSKLLSIC